MAETAKQRLAVLESLFHDALERGVDARAWLRETCDDPGLREEVHQLLDAHAETRDGLEVARAQLEPVIDAMRVARPLVTGQRIDDFVVGDVIARGGMGTVYQAQQVAPKRAVALKVMHARLGDLSSRRRFEHEAEILGRLRHRGIAHVYASGTVDADDRLLPWYAMELIAGARPLIGYAREQGLDRPARVRLLAQVCAAVHHGHQHGVIHRDLKPSNLLVDRDGTVKVIDFGIAKAVDTRLGLAALETLAGDVVGTPSYMSPEQAAGGNDDIDTRSDVYALGVILFELLTDRLPHHLADKTLMDALRVVVDEPADLGALTEARVDADLRAIVATALCKDRSRRYQSAEALGEDLRRYLAGEPVAARAPSTLYQLGKLARRHRAIVVAIGLVLASLIVAVGSAWWGLWRARQGQRIAEQERGRAEAQRAEAEAARREAETARQEAETARDEAQWGRTFLLGMLRDADPWQENGPEVPLIDAIDAAAARLDAAPGPIESEALLRGTLAEVYHHLGEYGRAEAHIRRALELRTEAYGEDDPRTLTAMTDLAATLSRQERFADARTWADRSAEKHERVLGSEDPATLRARHMRAGVLRGEGRHDEAKAVYREVLAARTRILGRRHTDAITSLNALAVSVWTEGDAKQAEPMFREVHELRTEVLGPEHPKTLQALDNLAAAIHAQARHEEAAGVYRRSLEIHRKVLGDDHLQTLTVMALYGLLRRQMGKLDEETERLSRGAFEGRTAVLGPGHSDALESRNNLGALYVSQKRYPDAIALYEEGLPLWRALPGDGRRFMNPLSNYGTALRESGRLRDALRVYDEAVAVAERSAGQRHWATWAIRTIRARCLHELGQTKRARVELEAAIPALAERKGPDDPYTARAVEALTEVYTELGVDDASATAQRLAAADR